MKFASLSLSLAIALGVEARAVRRLPAASKCPEFKKGSFVVEQYQLYPENADWDVNNCLVYFGSLFNSSVAVYDPYKDEMKDILEFDGITRNPALHIGGVGVDPRTNLVTIVVDAAAPFLTRGEDVSGDNWIMKYDPSKGELLWKLNITEVTKGQYGGFQDVEHDNEGSTYIVGTFPGTILKVGPAGDEVIPWYLPEDMNTTVTGFGGLAAIPEDDILLTNNNADGEIYRFDMGKKKGKPVLVKREPPVAMSGTDAIYLPPMYGGKVLLVSENAVGVTVMRSRDGRWETAEHLGTVSNDDDIVAAGALVTAPLQIGDRLFMVEEFFADSFVDGGVAGDRSEFPLFDITEQVEELLAAGDES